MDELNFMDELNDGWTETQTTGTVKLIDDGRIMVISRPNNVIISDTPAGGYGSRSAVVVGQDNIDELIAALQAAKQ